MNDRIRVPEVRLVGPNGEQVGIVRVEDALRLAQESDLDLVEVAPDARPPVCKLMDFGKFKYEADMKAREARRNQTNTVLKEIRFRLKIDPHDYGTKKGHVERFLKAGDKVKVMIMFRGREQSRPEMGIRLLQRLADDVAELGFIESSPKQDGRNMIMVLGPTKKKAEQKQEQRRAARDEAPRTPAARATAPQVVAPASPPATAASAPAQSAPAPQAPAPAQQAQAAPAAPSAAEDAPAAPAAAEAAPAAASPAAPRPAAAARPAASPRPAAAARPAERPASAAPAARQAPAASSAPAEEAPRPTPAPRPGPAAVKPVPAKPSARPGAAKPGAPRPSAGGTA
ncbi:translation initiation factor IF-3 [uncultured Cellulomonas sp.]|uniref:translation initiation factor IF-3 n=1 Tax=uncultured Cellulomonas sp. TaxID=189682 RepID=UPI00260DAC1C|nr:translation initiation factor IF-3 [uncultured Cellulomonas sp.]